MNPTILTAIERRLAEERLDAYRQDGAAPNVALGRYLWNVAVSESLYPVLQFAEVALRNRLHECLALRYFGPGWYDNTKCPLQPWQNEKVASAKQKLTKSGKTVTPGRVVAELEFGFWTDFFSNKHSSTGLAPYLAKHAFASAPSAEKDIKLLGARWKAVRELRNRVFHHERIIHWYDLDGNDLGSQHVRLLEVTQWLSPELHQLALLADRFPSVWQQGSTPWTAKVDQNWS